MASVGGGGGGGVLNGRAQNDLSSCRHQCRSVNCSTPQSSKSTRSPTQTLRQANADTATRHRRRRKGRRRYKRSTSNHNTTAAPFPLLMAPRHNSSWSRYRSDIGGTEHLSHLNKKKRSKRQEAKLAVSFTQPGNHFTLPPPPPPPSRQLPLSFNREPESQASSRGHLISTRCTLHNNTAQTKCSDKW